MSGLLMLVHRLFPWLMMDNIWFRIIRTPEENARRVTTCIFTTNQQTTATRLRNHSGEFSNDVAWEPSTGVPVHRGTLTISEDLTKFIEY
ncbi:hypothetical protein T265_04339 [Opisthorchis viverrini]|uniref:Uncharacterized protein n=1 Tax=Opisthorchis viverrini TaxID=6198 RepID=A0A074ZT01_OPIVI|nr:hypothetical protein T265_04339 [Opisthorchis viverrini]KER28962.1 hypothetical protein T265_04339 [Opisthorchis viverrini]